MVCQSETTHATGCWFGIVVAWLSLLITDSLPRRPFREVSKTAMPYWCGCTGTPKNSASTHDESRLAAKAPVAGWQQRLHCLRALPGDAQESSDVTPYASAAHAADLSGLPATYIAVGTLDLFVNEDIEYARRLIWAGVPTELKVYPGAYHGFEDMTPNATISRAFVRDYFNALQRALKRGECAAGQ